MSYRMYTTDALVCGTFDRNGSDRQVQLFTEQFGMLYATARSVREERSRQRFALQPFSFARVSLVKGKGGWRIGSVIAYHNVFLQAPTRDARAHVVRIVQTVRRFVHGEEVAPPLFGMVREALEALGHGAVQYPEVYVEAVLFRMLYALGYVAPVGAQHTFLEGSVAALDTPSDTATCQALRAAIQKASVMSQL